jgi:hypothetical protein
MIFRCRLQRHALLKRGRYRVGYVSALARTKVLFPAGTTRRCRVRFRPPRRAHRWTHRSRLSLACDTPQFILLYLTQLNLSLKCGCSISMFVLASLGSYKRMDGGSAGLSYKTVAPPVNLQLPVPSVVPSGLCTISTCEGMCTQFWDVCF